MQLKNKHSPIVNPGDHLVRETPRQGSLGAAKIVGSPLQSRKMAKKLDTDEFLRLALTKPTSCKIISLFEEELTNFMYNATRKRLAFPCQMSRNDLMLVQRVADLFRLDYVKETSPKGQEEFAIYKSSRSRVPSRKIAQLLGPTANTFPPENQPDRKITLVRKPESTYERRQPEDVTSSKRAERSRERLRRAPPKPKPPTVEKTYEPYTTDSRSQVQYDKQSSYTSQSSNPITPTVQQQTSTVYPTTISTTTAPYLTNAYGYQAYSYVPTVSMNTSKAYKGNSTEMSQPHQSSYSVYPSSYSSSNQYSNSYSYQSPYTTNSSYGGSRYGNTSVNYNNSSQSYASSSQGYTNSSQSYPNPYGNPYTKQNTPTQKGNNNTGQWQSANPDKMEYDKNKRNSGNNGSCVDNPYAWGANEQTSYNKAVGKKDKMKLDAFKEHRNSKPKTKQVSNPAPKVPEPAKETKKKISRKGKTSKSMYSHGSMGISRLGEFRPPFMPNLWRPKRRGGRRKPRGRSRRRPDLGRFILQIIIDDLDALTRPETASSKTVQELLKGARNGRDPYFFVCWDYNTETGCPRGSQCRWKHVRVSLPPSSEESVEKVVDKVKDMQPAMETPQTEVNAPETIEEAVKEETLGVDIEEPELPAVRIAEKTLKVEVEMKEEMPENALLEPVVEIPQEEPIVEEEGEIPDLTAHLQIQEEVDVKESVEVGEETVENVSEFVKENKSREKETCSIFSSLIDRSAKITWMNESLILAAFPGDNEVQSVLKEFLEKPDLYPYKLRPWFFSTKVEKLNEKVKEIAE